MRLAGKVALVTGAASGIGSAIVAAFLREGAEVIAADLQYTDTTSPAVAARRNVHLDVSSEADWERLTVPRLDVLVCCAGISDARPLPQTSLEDWRRVLRVNLDGAFLSVRFAARTMQKGGAVVLVGSASGIKASPGAGAYCAGKAAVRMLVKTAALELKPLNIRVNSVAPAGVVTPMWKATPMWDDLVKQHGGESGAWAALGGADPATPSLHRMALPDEVADSVLFLSSDASAHITGAEIVIDAGYTL